MKNRISTFCLCLVIFMGRAVCAEDPPSRLHLGISAWLKRQPKDDDSWKGRKEFPYTAVILNASADPRVLEFATGLSRFTKIQSTGWPGVKGDYLESLVIENTTLTGEHARQLEPIATEHLTLSNCEISDEVAKSLGNIRVVKSLKLEQLRMSDQALISLGRIESVQLSLNGLRISDRALSGFLSSKKLNEVEAEEIRGCTSEGWRGLSDRAQLTLKLADCDFDDQALLHLSTSRCSRIQAQNVQLNGSTLGSLSAQKDCLIRLSLSGSPITDQGLQTLPGFSKLQSLDLSGTQITDDGFSNFKMPDDLRGIEVAGTKVTQAKALEITRQYKDYRLTISFHNDPRWPPSGGYCQYGEFHLYK